MSQLPLFLVVLTRGGHIESEHRVEVAFDSSQVPWKFESEFLSRHFKDGSATRTLFGNPAHSVFPRSAVKLFQAIPLVQSGAADRFQLEPRHLALACASHCGEPFHTETVKEWLERIGLPMTCLHCGVHEPADRATAHFLIRNREEPSRLHHNCSGKHTGVLTTCVHHGENVEHYEDLTHPAQQRIRKVYQDFTQMPLGPDSFAIDGCRMPAVRFPLQTLARAGVRLIQAANGGAPDLETYHQAARRILEAIQSYPEYTSGSSEISAQIMKMTEGRVVLKSGAEGVYLALIPEREQAIAFKCQDGNMRATKTLLVYLLAQLGFLQPSQLQELDPFMPETTKDRHGARTSFLEVVLEVAGGQNA